MTDLDARINLAHAAHGDMTAFYQNVRSRFTFSEMLAGPPELTAPERAAASADLIEVLEMLFALHLLKQQHKKAYFVRLCIGAALDEMRTALDEIKEAP
ncbi:MAG TPA: hypothetical protein VMY35_03065 [Phycisphaerae bacterium]|nr:hypothetical protein [Phycisphaerae bacterium]